MTTPAEDYFARVEPLLGRGLVDATVAVERPSLSARVIELLAACRLRRLILRDLGEPLGWPASATLRRSAREKLPAKAAAALADYLAWKNAFVPMDWLRDGRADLSVGARLLLPGASPFVEWDRAQRRITLHLVAGDLFGHESLSVAVARSARDILLGRAPFPEGRTFFGSTGWPHAQGPRPLSAPEADPVDLDGKHLLVVGLGSVGSEVVRLLHGRGARWTLVDGGRVTVFNPHRQWYGCDEIGRSKVEALAARLAPGAARVVPERLGADGGARLAQLIAADRPDAVLLTTGTDDDAALAEVTWLAGVPHLAAYAYPQARFFEVSVMLPAEGTPCLHCLRGHLFSGAAAQPHVEDEVSRFLYREVDREQREALYRNLVAEPATPIETSRIAAVVAQCAAQIVAAPPGRGLWFRRLLQASTTCLLGGNVAEVHDGEPAYGITFPGQVVRLGLEDLVGAERQRRCRVCGRELRTAHRLELPVGDDDLVDRALAAL
jgi:hypothetical protein